MPDISIDNLPYGSEGLCPHCKHKTYCEKSTRGGIASKQSCSLNEFSAVRVSDGKEFYPKKRYEFEKED